MDFATSQGDIELIQPRYSLKLLLSTKLDKAVKKGLALPGIEAVENKVAFLEQLVESIRRVDYVAAIASRPISSNRADPGCDCFDPIRAAVLKAQAGDAEEASWLVFLATHFGKASRTGWLLTKDVYGALGAGHNWTWPLVSTNPVDMSQWIARNLAVLRSGGRKFGNHRKYESLDPAKSNSTGEIIESYVNWVMQHGSHTGLFTHALMQSEGNPRAAFGMLYRSMGAVKRFGRTGKFDYLTMIAKVGISAIVADSTYMAEATGPLKGARLLFGGTTKANLSAVVLEQKIQQLDSVLDVGMQVIEDALCNWQKSPGNFVRFRG
ncbi:alpha-glutamyl/putrescinyl thymine pyrophosphorylase clade 3 protein [Pseudomonas corrugata]